MSKIKRIFYRCLAKIWYIPFGYYNKPLKNSNKTPHPLVPRNMRDLTLNTMMFPDDIMRAVVADKVSARGWVAEKIGTHHLTKLLDICDSGDQLRLDKYPLPFVVKSSHASGHFKLIETKSDMNGLPKLADHWLRQRDIAKQEWCYADIQPKLLVEELLADDHVKGVYDLKVFCMFGTPVLLHIIQDRFGTAQKSFFTPDWEHREIQLTTFYDKLPTPPSKPENLAEILKLAEILSVDFNHIRVDFLLKGTDVYFGELTNFTEAGHRMLRPEKADVFLFEEYNRLRKKKIQSLRKHYSNDAHHQKYRKDSNHSGLEKPE